MPTCGRQRSAIKQPLATADLLAPMDLTTLAVEPLGRHHDRAAFSCDEPSLTDYLRKQARQDVDRDLASCWVLCTPGDSAIIGYYTLTATSVDVSSLPPDLA